MGVIIIAVLIIKLIEFPLMTLCEYLIDHVGNNKIIRLEVEDEAKDPHVQSASPDMRLHKIQSIKVSAKVAPVEDRDLEYSNMVPLAMVVPLALFPKP